MVLNCTIFFLISVVCYFFENSLKKKKHIISSALLLLLIFLMVSGNYQNADTYSSEITYNANTVQKGFAIIGQWAYYLLINICNGLRMSYYQYRFVAYGIGYIALLLAINRTKTNKYWVLIMYMAFTMIIDSTQTKNFLAMSFITLAITFLISGTKKDKIVFVLLIILASGFHVVSFIYLPLIIICDADYNKKIKSISVLPIVLFSLVFSNRSMSAVLSKFVLSHMDDTLSRRASAFFLSSVNNGYLVYFLATAISIFLVYKMKKSIIECENSTDEEKRFSSIAFYCALFSLAFLPLYFLRQDFSRLFRNFFPVFHILFVMYITVQNRCFTNSDSQRLFVIRHNKKQAIIVVAYCLLIGYMFFWDIYIYKDSVLTPFFQYNSVFGN